MDRLSFTMPKFRRLSWVSDRAMAVWKPRLLAVAKTWLQLEKKSVLAGARHACLFQDSSQNAELFFRGVDHHSLKVMQINSHSEDGTADPNSPRWFAFGSSTHLCRLCDAWRANDVNEVGTILGYPSCCRLAYSNWTLSGFVDISWCILRESLVSADGYTGDIPLSALSVLSPLWLWAGVRSVSHAPCSLGCARSIEIAANYRALASFEEQESLVWRDEILSWPAEWSASHGIGELKTPILRASHDTDPTSAKYIVRKQSLTYPNEGATGIVFPYRQPTRTSVYLSPAFQRGLSGS